MRRHDPPPTGHEWDPDAPEGSQTPFRPILSAAAAALEARVAAFIEAESKVSFEPTDQAAANRKLADALDNPRVYGEPRE